MALYSAYTVFQGLVQLQLIPMIVDWANTASIKENDGSDDRLMAVNFWLLIVRAKEEVVLDAPTRKFNQATVKSFKKTITQENYKLFYVNGMNRSD